LALEQLSNLLRRHRRIALDSSIFIYQLDANPRYLPLTAPLFRALESPAHVAVTSTVTWTELLVPAYASSRQDLTDQYLGLLSTYPRLQWIAPDLVIADLAARLRARYGLRTPDALQAATALHTRATLLVTNDRAFRKVASLTTVLLDDLL
jgi:predicted nucleic acid-binding protein